MVCFYFYHPGGAPRFSWFSCVFIWWYFWYILMCSCVLFWHGFPVFFVVLFLVSFGDFAGGIFCAFPGVFFTVFWCFFPCLSLFFSIYVSPWWWSCFLPCFFSWVFGCFFSCFLWYFFCIFYRVFFRAFFSFFFLYFFSIFFFFMPWVVPETNNHNILHFGPCFFRCFFW